MAFTSKLYGKVFLSAFNKEIDWVDDAQKVTLHTSSYTPDQDAHDYQNDLTNELTSSGGYTAGGATLASKTLTYTAGSNRVTLDAADVTWSGFSNTFRTAVVADTQSGSAATNPLIEYHQNDADISPGGTDLTLQWNANGLATIDSA